MNVDFYRKDFAWGAARTKHFWLILSAKFTKKSLKMIAMFSESVIELPFAAFSLLIAFALDSLLMINSIPFHRVSYSQFYYEHILENTSCFLSALRCCLYLNFYTNCLLQNQAPSLTF